LAATDACLNATDDCEHLSFTANTGRVVITQDVDFLRLHAGEYSPIHAALSPDDIKNRVEYL